MQGLVRVSMEQGRGILSKSPERHRHGAKVSFVLLLVLRLITNFVIILFVNPIDAGTVIGQ